MAKDPREYKTNIRNLLGDVVALAVGSDEERLAVHEVLLRERSPFFATALKPEWKEGQEHKICLPDDDIHIVHLYLQWIYWGKIWVRPTLEETGPEDDEMETLISLFIFGEKVQDGDFRDAVISALFFALNTPDKDDRCWMPGSESVQRVYRLTPSHSPLRRFLVDVFAWSGDASSIDGSRPLDLDYLVDLTKKLMDVRKKPSGKDPTGPTADVCQYHQHGEGAKCRIKQPAPVKKS